MTQEKPATFAKVSIENGVDAKTVYSFRLERIHWVFGILASIAAIALALLVLRAAIYSSAADEFSRQLKTFHAEAQPAIRALMDRKIAGAAEATAAGCAVRMHKSELAHEKKLGEIKEILARLDERLAGIERRLP